MRYVIIGNSAAAVGAVEKIRQLDTGGEIIIISREPHHTYSRPLISYLLQGKTDEQKMKYRDDAFYERNKCAFLSGRTAKRVCPDKKYIELDDEEAVSYDKLLIATGSSAFVPPFEGLDTVTEKHTFMTLSDARKLQAALGRDKNVLIVGAGLIGLKCAEGIADKVKSVTVADVSPRILSSILDDEGAAIVQGHLENRGIKFILSSAVKSFDGNKARLFP